MNKMDDDREVSLGYGPDSIDAFKYHALREGKFDTPGFRFSFIVEDHHLLNQRALSGELEITGLSVHSYAYVHEEYELLSCGASIGDGYGPVVVGRYDLDREELGNVRLAIPGTRTTAHLVLQLYAGSTIEAEVVPPAEMLGRILDGEFDAGLIIHEDLMTYRDSDVARVVDLGAWWKRETGLPLPVGTVAVRRNVDEPERLGGHLKRSIQYGMDHAEEVFEAISPRFDRLSSPDLKRYVDLYVNDYALDYGRQGRKAVHELLNRSYEQNLIPAPISPVFIQVK